MGNGKNHVFAREIEEIVDNMTLMDDDLMSHVFDQNIPATEVLLRVVLGDKIEVVETKAQYEMESPIVGGRSIRLDIFARSQSGDYFDCEIQRLNRGAIPRRARLHASMMDSRMLAAGEGYTELKDSYVIFITENDYFHEGKPLYTIVRKRDDKDGFDDGSYIIYVNGKYEGDDDIGRMLSDFRRRELTGFNYPELENGVRQFKERMEGRRAMCEAVERYAEKVGEKKYNVGKEEGKIESIHALMVNLHLSAEQAMESIGIPKNEFEKYMKML